MGCRSMLWVTSVLVAAAPVGARGPLASQHHGVAPPAEALPRLLWESSFSSEQPIVTESVVGMPEAALLEPPVATEGLTAESTEVVRGIVEGFLHRQNLQDGEAKCLGKGTGQLAGDVMAVSANLVMMFEQAMGRKPSIAGYSRGQAPRPRDGASGVEDKVDSMMTSAGPSEEDAKQLREERAKEKARLKAKQKANAQMAFFYGGGRRLKGFKLDAKLMAMAPGILMQMGVAAKRMISVAQQVVKDCLHHDALEALDRAAAHMQNVQYVSGHLMANGQDIVGELARSVTAYKAKEYRNFGTDLGTALRKVLLSKVEPGQHLPEGLPGKDVIANITTGLLRGLFGEGAKLDIRIPGDLDRAPSSIHIDLHRCITKNLFFFQAVFQELMWFYARSAAGTLEKKEEVQWSTAVAFTMMKVPQALDRCNLGPKEQEMLEDAIKGMASKGEAIDLDVKMPDTKGISSDRLEKHLAITVQDWATQQWSTFGRDLGKLLQELAITVYERKYVLDSKGILRRAEEQRILQHRSTGAPSAIFVSFAAAGAAVGLIAAWRRAWPHPFQAEGTGEDVEGTLLAVE